MYPSYLGYFYFLVSILIRLTRFMHLHLFEVNYPKEVWKIFIWLVEYFLLSSFLFWSRLTRWDFPRNPCNDFFFYNVFLSKFLHIWKTRHEPIADDDRTAIAFDHLHSLECRRVGLKRRQIWRLKIWNPFSLDKTASDKWKEGKDL